LFLVRAGDRFGLLGTRKLDADDLCLAPPELLFARHCRFRPEPVYGPGTS